MFFLTTKLSEWLAVEQHDFLAERWNACITVHFNSAADEIDAKHFQVLWVQTKRQYYAHQAARVKIGQHHHTIEMKSYFISLVALSTITTQKWTTKERTIAIKRIRDTCNGMNMNVVRRFCCLVFFSQNTRRVMHTNTKLSDDFIVSAYWNDCCGGKNDINLFFCLFPCIVNLFN